MSLAGRGVVCLYGATRAVDGVDLEIARGSVTTLVGANGAGKTTLLRVLCGERTPEDGGLFLDDAPVSGRDPDLRRRVGLLSHETGLYRNLTVLENLRFFGRLFGVTGLEDGVHAALRRVGAEGLGGEQARRLSRGQRQRVALARTLLHDPELVFLDEPFTGLDPAGADALEGILKDLRSRERTVVMVTHDLPRAIRLSDRVVVMSAGRIVSDLPAADATIEELTRWFGVRAAS